MSPPDGTATRRRILVVTGDHHLPDPTKWSVGYSGDDLDLHRRMCDALESLDEWKFTFLGDHGQLVRHILDDPPEFVLNLCDTGFRNVPTQELHVPALLEMAGVPYSGAPPAGMVLCYDKAVVRLLAASLDVPVPAETVVDPASPRLDGVTFPAFIKPATGDGSVGISRDAMVEDADAARRTLAWLHETLPGRPALVQEYLPGPEYGLGLVGNPGHGFTAFPPLQVDFSALPAGLPPILAFESKTGPETAYEQVRVIPAALDDAQTADLQAHAEKLFARLQCRDYARFDFRTGADGVVKLLEVNPNPAWSATAKLALMAGFGGISYVEFWRLILQAAQARLGGDF